MKASVDLFTFKLGEGDFQRVYSYPMKEVRLLASQIGLDLEQDKDLLWFLKQALVNILPQGWAKEKDPKGGTQYHNADTGITTEMHPLMYIYRSALSHILERSTGAAAPVQDSKPQSIRQRRLEPTSLVSLGDPDAYFSALIKKVERQQDSDPERLSQALREVDLFYSTLIPEQSVPLSIAATLEYQSVDPEKMLSAAKTLGVQEDYRLLWIARMYCALPLPPLWKKSVDAFKSDVYINAHYEVMLKSHPGTNFFYKFAKRLMMGRIDEQPSTMVFLDSKFREFEIDLKRFLRGENYILHTSKEPVHHLKDTKLFQRKSSAEESLSDVMAIEIAESCGFQWEEDIHLLGIVYDHFEEMKRENKLAGWEFRFTLEGQKYWYHPETQQASKSYPFRSELKAILNSQRITSFQRFGQVAKQGGNIHKAFEGKSAQFISDTRHSVSDLMCNFLSDRLDELPPDPQSLRLLLDQLDFHPLSSTEAHTVLFACPFRIDETRVLVWKQPTITIEPALEDDIEPVEEEDIKGIMDDIKQEIEKVEPPKKKQLAALLSQQPARSRKNTNINRKGNLEPSIEGMTLAPGEHGGVGGFLTVKGAVAEARPSSSQHTNGKKPKPEHSMRLSVGQKPPVLEAHPLSREEEGPGELTGRQGKRHATYRSAKEEKWKVQRAKNRQLSLGPQKDRSVEDSKAEDSKVEGSKVEGSKVEDSKVEDRKVEDSKVEERKVEERKDNQDTAIVEPQSESVQHPGTSPVCHEVIEAVKARSTERDPTEECTAVRPIPADPVPEATAYPSREIIVPTKADVPAIHIDSAPTSAELKKEETPLAAVKEAEGTKTKLARAEVPGHANETVARVPMKDPKIAAPLEERKVLLSKEGKASSSPEVKEVSLLPEGTKKLPVEKTQPEETKELPPAKLEPLASEATKTLPPEDKSLPASAETKPQPPEEKTERPQVSQKVVVELPFPAALPESPAHTPPPAQEPIALRSPEPQEPTVAPQSEDEKETANETAVIHPRGEASPEPDSHLVPLCDLYHTKPWDSWSPTPPPTAALFTPRGIMESTEKPDPAAKAAEYIQSEPLAKTAFAGSYLGLLPSRTFVKRKEDESSEIRNALKSLLVESIYKRTHEAAESPPEKPNRNLILDVLKDERAKKLLERSNSSEDLDTSQGQLWSNLLRSVVRPGLAPAVESTELHPSFTSILERLKTMPKIAIAPQVLPIRKDSKHSTVKSVKEECRERIERKRQLESRKPSLESDIHHSESPPPKKTSEKTEVVVKAKMIEVKRAKRRILPKIELKLGERTEEAQCSKRSISCVTGRTLSTDIDSQSPKHLRLPHISRFDLSAFHNPLADSENLQYYITALGHPFRQINISRFAPTPQLLPSYVVLMGKRLGISASLLAYESLESDLLAVAYIALVTPLPPGFPDAPYAALVTLPPGHHPGDGYFTLMLEYQRACRAKELKGMTKAERVKSVVDNSWLDFARVSDRYRHNFLTGEEALSSSLSILKFARSQQSLHTSSLSAIRPIPTHTYYDLPTPRRRKPLKTSRASL